MAEVEQHIHNNLRAEEQLVHQLQADLQSNHAAAAAKDAEVAAAAQKLHELTQQLAAHEHAADSAAAAKEAELAGLSRQLAAQSDVVQQLQIVIRDSGNSTAAKDVHIAQLAEQLANARLDWASLQSASAADTDALQSCMKEQHARLQQLQSEVWDSSRSLAAKDSQIAELTKQLSAVRVDWTKHAAGKDTEHAGLVAQLTDSQSRVQELQTAVRDSTSRSTAKDAQLAELTEQLSSARQDWSALQAAKDSEISALSCQLAEKQSALDKLQEAAMQRRSADSAESERNSSQMQVQLVHQRSTLHSCLMKVVIGLGCVAAVCVCPRMSCQYKTYKGQTSTAHQHLSEFRYHVMLHFLLHCSDSSELDCLNPNSETVQQRPTAPV